MNSIMEMFNKWGIRFEDNLKCGGCGKDFKEHTDDDLKECSIAG